MADARSRRRNPFKPTAGMRPPELIGRAGILDEFAESLDNGVGAPACLMRISGVRGVGKTALLDALGDVARSDGFTVVNVASGPGFTGEIARIAAGPSRPVTLEPEVLGVKLGLVGLPGRPEGLRAALEAAARKGGLFVTVDEIQDAPQDEMRGLGNMVQLLVREGVNIAFAFAGLPSGVERVVNGEGLTFLQRAVQVTLERLRDEDVLESMSSTIRGSGMGIGPDVAGSLAEAAAGYPFMVQLVGYHCWQTTERRGSSRIEAADAEVGIRTARRQFDATVIEPALRRLSDGQVEYLLAMAGIEGGVATSGGVAQALGRSTKSLGTVRARLIRSGIVEPRGYGKVWFTIPYMREYLQRNEQAIRDELGLGEG